MADRRGLGDVVGYVARNGKTGLLIDHGVRMGAGRKKIPVVYLYPGWVTVNKPEERREREKPLSADPG